MQKIQLPPKSEILQQIQSVNIRAALEFSAVMRDARTKYFGPEDWLQTGACIVLRHEFPTLVAWHPKNESKGGWTEQAKKTHMGVMAGVSDLEVNDPRQVRNLYIEFKWGGNGLTPDQKKFLEFQAARGNATAIVRNIAEAIAAAKKYIIL